MAAIESSITLPTGDTERTRQDTIGGSLVKWEVVSLTDTAGNIITPAQENPTAKYILCETDTAGTPQYFGYEDKDGNWYISQNTSGVWRYEVGASNFSTAWTNRASQSYGYPSAKW